MKKLLFMAALAVFGLSSNSYAQGDDSGGGQTDQGSWLIEANTGFGEAAGGGTGIYLRSIDGTTAWNIGFDAGYFIIDDLALKGGLGYGDSGQDGVDGMFGWKFGAKYYIIGMIPVGADVNGASGNGFSPMWVGIQAGYAWFITDSVSVEPGLRYGLGMNEDAGDGDFNQFSFNVGFAIHL
ncbi:MAG: hypothetical protein K8F54_12260 [Altibacter sp.]|uniref:hypothetical protein n=1 Tax=Altibacter sp. TaxID=2024823 RepID=UPI001D34CFA7|nr:hypothetical protein [Altibacter sp.]MBZ0328375.1 hypothetical protein [Altibacter sp.]